MPSGSPVPAGPRPKLALKGITKRFGSVAAVDGLTLELNAGEFVSLLGPSGCGKTTTLRMIAGFIPPDAGTVEVDGAVLSSPGACVPPERRGMSMIFQSYAVWPNMTVAENVAFGLKLRKTRPDERARRVKQMLETVRLSALAGRYPAELSGGQQQRVALARAVIVQPAVLLLDEPLSNLDANLREEMRFEIRRLHEAFHITTVYVTHDQAEAMVTSDRIAVMNGGRIEQLDSPEDLYSRPLTRFVAGFIGRTNFVTGTVAGDRVSFPGFTVPLAALNGAAAAQPSRLYSVRPQNLGLSAHPQPPGEGFAARPGTCRAPGRIVQRAYLGEHWDYLVRLDGTEEPLRVTALPQQRFDTGAAVWLEIDPAHLVPIA
ncbi:MAG: ABC transporter ATP-binding protein [SAR324 cluster bacterium]